MLPWLQIHILRYADDGQDVPRFVQRHGDGLTDRIQAWEQGRSGTLAQQHHWRTSVVFIGGGGSTLHYDNRYSSEQSSVRIGENNVADACRVGLTAWSFVATCQDRLIGGAS